jgi:hypothetical protein
MPAVTAARQSTVNVVKNSSDLNKAVNGVWRIAKKAPMFSKTSVNEKTGVERTTYTRMLPTIAYKIAVSGACASVSGLQDAEMDKLGMNIYPDSKTLPWTCALSPGAAFMLDQFLGAVCKQIVFNARLIRSGVGKHSKNHKAVTKLAIEEVKRAVFDTASAVPISTIILPMGLARKKKKGEEEAPGDKEAVDDAVDEVDDDEVDDGEEDKEEGEEGEEEDKEEEEEEEEEEEDKE